MYKFRLVYSVYPMNAKSLNCFYEIVAESEKDHITEELIESAKIKVREKAAHDLKFEMNNLIVSFMLPIENVIE